MADIGMLVKIMRDHLSQGDRNSKSPVEEEIFGPPLNAIYPTNYPGPLIRASPKEPQLSRRRPGLFLVRPPITRHV